MAAQNNILLRKRQRPVLAATRNLQLYEIEAGDSFGDRVLDLQPRVHFKEMKIAMGIDQEFRRAGVGVRGGARQTHGSLTHRAAELRRDERRRRFLDDFLVAALHRTFPLAEIDGVSMCVGEELYLDVPRTARGSVRGKRVHLQRR